MQMTQHFVPSLFVHQIFAMFAHGQLMSLALSFEGYSDVAMEDDKTRQFKELVPQWRTICGRRDDEVGFPSRAGWKLEHVFFFFYDLIVDHGRWHRREAFAES